MSKRVVYTILFSWLLTQVSFSQKVTPQNPVPVDSVVKKAPVVENPAKADSVRRAFSPKKATIRSAILPGWGQIYNHKYWKLPIIYGALGVTASVFVYNLKTYRDLRFAYAAKYKASVAPFDSTDYRLLKPIYLAYDANALRIYRDEFRSNIDYSVLVFFLFWGLNVVDATVDAHLKLFDVNPDLSLKLKFGPSQMAGTNGLSLILAFNKH